MPDLPFNDPQRYRRDLPPPPPRPVNWRAVGVVVTLFLLFVAAVIVNDVRQQEYRRAAAKAARDAPAPGAGLVKEINESVERKLLQQGITKEKREAIRKRPKTKAELEADRRYELEQKRTSEMRANEEKSRETCRAVYQATYRKPIGELTLEDLRMAGLCDSLGFYAP